MEYVLFVCKSVIFSLYYLLQTLLLGIDYYFFKMGRKLDRRVVLLTRLVGVRRAGGWLKPKLHLCIISSKNTHPTCYETRT